MSDPTTFLRVTVSGPADLAFEVPASAEGPSGNEVVAALPASAEDLALGRQRREVVIDGWRFEVVVERADRAALRERAQQAAAASQSTSSVRLRAQIPGRVTRLWVAAGDRVEQGQRLLAIEAMKMENEVRAPRAGTLDEIAVEEGQLVELNQELLTLGGSAG
ncbi:MAG TPA: biotin/lipoyl-containing protein [Candidatus Limnocylindrales bacterium]|nr:biotin/lipoyl-containing protein [Candidatus Limnocylindrales bacterium]